MSNLGLGYWTHLEHPPNPPIFPFVATAKRLDEDCPMHFHVLGPKKLEGGRTGRTRSLILQAPLATDRLHWWPPLVQVLAPPDPHQTDLQTAQQSQREQTTEGIENG
jgi:hypothetical protein